MIIEATIITVILSVIVIGSIACRNSEKKEWNKGYCAECNTEWKLADTDSQGGRLYTCQCKKFHRCWISYHVDHKIKH